MALQEGSEPSRIKFKPTSKALALTVMEPSEKKPKIDIEAEMCETLIPEKLSLSATNLFPNDVIYLIQKIEKLRIDLMLIFVFSFLCQFISIDSRI